MKQLLLVLIVFIFSCLGAHAQQDKLHLVDSRNMIIEKNSNITKFYRPLFRHNESTLSADSGYLNRDQIGREFFDAYGNVIITQPNGTQIFSDKLHYDATTQVATLTGAVRMVSNGGATLTTNYLVYNMRSKVGTYTGGGRIISNRDTITSKNAYYFENTGDSYFRNKVIVRTPNVKIYTDSMRYNGISHMTYFYGPTNIKGNKGENLYTEKGNYNTSTGQAYFSKKNLYTEGSKFLKGDSLYYDRRTGEGKAIRNVVFVDTLDKFYAYGGFGHYRSNEESITMTDKPLIISVVKKDSTAQDSTQQDSLPPVEIQKDNVKKETKKLAKTDKKIEQSVIETTDNPAQSKHQTAGTDVGGNTSAVDSVYMTADTLYSRMIFRSEYHAKNFQLDRSGGALDVEEEVNYGDDESDSTFNDLPSLGDSIATTTLSTDSLLKNLPLEKVVKKIDSTKVQSPTVPKKLVPHNNPPIVHGDANRIEIESHLKADSILRQKTSSPTGQEADKLMDDALKKAQENKPDSVTRDTAKTRIIKAYYNVRMFKSDFQAVADSMYYGMVDSMFRLMGKPMIWAEQSQISADTIFMQIVNQKIDNALLVGNAFMVNATQDSTKFNQIKGRKITSFFTNNKMDRLFVDGNAENILYNTDEKTQIATELIHDRSSRFKILMENNKLTEYVSIRKVDGKVYPLAQISNDKEFLPNFIWRPEDRPKSKEDLLNRKRDLSKSSFTAPEAKDSDLEEENSAPKNIPKRPAGGPGGPPAGGLRK